MTQLADELLVSYTDGELSKPQAKAVEAVLADDPETARRVSQLSVTRAKLTKAFAEVLPPPLHEVLSSCENAPHPAGKTDNPRVREIENALTAKSQKNQSGKLAPAPVSDALPPLSAPADRAPYFAEKEQLQASKSSATENPVSNVPADATIKTESLTVAELAANERAANDIAGRDFAATDPAAANFNADDFNADGLDYDDFDDDEPTPDEFWDEDDWNDKGKNARSAGWGITLTAGLLGIWLAGAVTGYFMYENVNDTTPPAISIHETKTARQDMLTVVATAHNMFRRDSLEISAEAQGNATLMTFHLANLVGQDITIPNLKENGFTFKRAQILNLNTGLVPHTIDAKKRITKRQNQTEPQAGEVVQLSYLGKNGGPLSLYIQPGPGPTATLNSHAGTTNAVWWGKDGLRFVLAGQLPHWQLVVLSVNIRRQSADSAS